MFHKFWTSKPKKSNTAKSIPFLLTIQYKSDKIVIDLGKYFDGGYNFAEGTHVQFRNEHGA